MYNWIEFPYKNNDNDTILNGGYLYAVGGYHTPDDGCPGWGTAILRDIRFIGDSMGDIVIIYEDGDTDKIPLIFGYTLWYHSIWNEKPAPFFGDETDNEIAETLKSALFVKGGYECEELGVIRVALKEKAVKSIFIESNTEKNGDPVFYGGYLADKGCAESQEILIGGKIDVAAADDFFKYHTVNPEDLYPESCKAAIYKICHALHTFQSDFDSAPERFTFPEGKPQEGLRITFSGNRLAAIASGVVYNNMKNLTERTDSDGFIHTSYQNAPSWRYDGFGPYVMRANSYTDSFYSRDGARAIMTLNNFGHIEKAESGCNFGNKWMMYYPEQGLTINNVPIPGHFSVIPNKPMIYSEVLVNVGWPTKYTEEKFGSGYKNLGNQETDGHGLMMMANYLVWKNTGGSDTWIEKNWKYINEAAEWINWCQKNIELSFARDGLLYGETEAAMNDWTLYANIPCYLGLIGYIEMAEKIGRKEKTEIWKTCAENLRIGIDRHFTNENGWDMARKGFHHDPVVTMMADIYGYDTDDMLPEWVARSKSTYEEDIKIVRELGFYGKGGGIGYDHSMITQNALLLDKMNDVGKLVESLCKISYSPRLPEPYIVPEGICVDFKRGILRRQGDLGNLVQLAEAMKCYHIVMGISPLNTDTLKIMPRLPEDWQIDVEDFTIQNIDAKLNMSVSYPKDGKQTADISIKGNVDLINTAIKELSFRFGPFKADLNKADVTLNGKDYTVPLVLSGDCKWAWVKENINEFINL